MVFHWRLSDSKSPQVSRTLLSILAVFNNAVVWMVSTWPPTSKSSRPFNNPLVAVPKVPITFGIIVTFMFHIFFNSLARSRYLSLFSQFRVFHTSVGWLSFTRVWVTTSLLRFPRTILRILDDSGQSFGKIWQKSISQSYMIFQLRPYGPQA